METQFRIILQRLDNIERILTNLQNDKEQKQTQPPPRQILTLVEFCKYVGISKQTVYKLTASKRVPHSKRGKTLYFDREKIDAWLLENEM